VAVVVTIRTGLATKARADWVLAATIVTDLEVAVVVA